MNPNTPEGHGPEPSHPAPGFRELLSQARPHQAVLWMSLALNVIASVLTLAQPMVAKVYLDRLAANTPGGSLVLFMLLLLVAGAVITAFAYYLIERTAEKVVHGVRTHMVGRILRLRLSTLHRTDPGDLISRVVSDSNQLRTATTSNLVGLVVGTLQLVGIVLLMAYLDLALFGVVVGVVVVVGCAFVTVLPRIRNANLRVQEALGDMGGVLERSITALRTIKASNAEEREIGAVTGAAEQAMQQGIRAARWTAVGGVSTGLILQVSFLIVLGFGGARVASGGLEVSTLVAFLLFLFYMTGPISQLTSSISGLQLGLAALQRITEVSSLEIEETVPASDGADPARSSTWTETRGASASFHAVGFGYTREGPRVFDDVTFDVPAGGMTAIVGPSGAGKSTLFSLIERFYEVDSGSIRLDGRDIRGWPLHELRRGIGYVEQEAPVLSGTLRENLLLAAPDTDDSWLEEVIARARLGALVDRMEDGLDTRIGHQGATLSGGERQRVAIARALLRKPRLLLLDEATSQLDSINEQALQEAVARAAEITTVMVIAHRISTVRNADRILVLDDRQVRSIGSHEELMKSDGLYRELAEQQFISAADPRPAHGERTREAFVGR